MSESETRHVLIYPQLRKVGLASFRAYAGLKRLCFRTTMLTSQVAAHGASVSLQRESVEIVDLQEEPFKPFVLNDA